MLPYLTAALNYNTLKNVKRRKGPPKCQQLHSLTTIVTF